MFDSVERRYELESLRRSFVMLQPEARPLVRDQAVALVEELAELQWRIRRMTDGLRQLLAEVEGSEPGGPPSSSPTRPDGGGGKGRESGARR